MTTISSKPALVRHGGRLKNLGELTGTEIATAIAPAQQAALAGKPRTKIQIVAHAVENDPDCKGKAALALSMLADDDYAPVSAAGIVKLLRKARGTVSFGI